jgi:hypothetical protein
VAAIAPASAPGGFFPVANQRRRRVAAHFHLTTGAVGDEMFLFLKVVEKQRNEAFRREVRFPQS